MSLNRKQRLFIFFAVLLVVIGGVYLLHYLTWPRNLNVILITIDALRADRLSCYGYKKDTSPNIDKLAKEGILFTQAISQGSHTDPSIASIVASTYPSTHKIYEWSVSLPPKLLTIGEILKNHGYYNFLCSGHRRNLFGIIGLSRGFDEYSSPEEARGAEKANEEALNFLAKAKDKNRKFFLWVHYMDVHAVKLKDDGPTEEPINLYKDKYLISL